LLVVSVTRQIVHANERRMKRLVLFLKATTLGGLFVVLPLFVLILLATRLVLEIHTAAKTLIGKLAGESSEAAHFPILFSILLVVAVSFLIGLVMISRRAQSANNWFEGRILFRLPGYAAMKAIVGGLAGESHEGALRSGLLTVDPGIECLVFIVEDHGDRLTVFIPGSPNPGNGAVQIVRKDLVRPLNARITEVGTALQQWGHGSAKVLAKHGAVLPPELPVPPS
jgi:uncharacterized membrane protein